MGCIDLQIECYSHLRRQISLAIFRKQEALPLGESRAQALRRLHFTERSLNRRAWEPFRDAVMDSASKGHAELNQIQNCKYDTFYLPMHAVIKPSSTTTKTRIVFNASAKSKLGQSLNDALLHGPNVYSSITDQIIKFHVHLIAMSADISQMFRQIELLENDRDLLRFLFREKTR